MSLNLCLLLFSFCICGPALVMFKASDKSELARKLPRERILGSLLTLASFYWAGIQGYTLLKEDFATISRWIPIILPPLALASCFFIDYLFTRALGAFLVLLCTHYLALQFAMDVPMRWLSSSAIYLIALWGMFLIGQPWILRDLLEKCRDQAKIRQIAFSGFLLLNIIICVVPNL